MNAKASAFHPAAGKIRDIHPMPGISPGGSREFPGTCDRCVWGRGEHSPGCVKREPEEPWILTGVKFRFNDECLVSDLMALLDTYSLEIKVKGTIWLEAALIVLPTYDLPPGSKPSIKREDEIETSLIPFSLPLPMTRAPFFVEKPLHVEISLRLDAVLDFWYWRIFRFEPGQTYGDYVWKP